jgi:hypothetical protein
VDAAAGREIVMTRAGKLVPADFDAPLPAKVLDGFEGR